MDSNNFKNRWLIITPTLGKSPYLKKTVDSLKNIPGIYEHIIVCPAYKKNSLEKEYPNSKIVTELVGGNKGMYSAINLGIQSCSIDYDYFCYINDDDYFLPPMMEVSNYLVEGLECIYYARTSIVNSHNVEIYKAPCAKYQNFVKNFLKAREIPFMQPSMIVPKVVIKKLKGFKESYKYCGDLDFILRALSINIRFTFINCMTNAFRVHEGQLSGARINMEYEREKAYFENEKYIKQNYIFFLMLKITFKLININIYIQRLKNTRKLTSNNIFYG